MKLTGNSWSKLLEKLLNEQDSLQKKIEELNGDFHMAHRLNYYHITYIDTENSNLI